MKTKKVQTALGTINLQGTVRWNCKRLQALEVFSALQKQLKTSAWAKLAQFMAENECDPYDHAWVGYVAEEDALVYGTRSHRIFVAQDGELLLLNGAWSTLRMQTDALLGSTSSCCPVPAWVVDLNKEELVRYPRPVSGGTPSDEELRRILAQDGEAYLDFLDRLDQEFGEEVVEDEDC